MLLQFAEGLSDRQAVNAVQSRIDWKYVLRLELTDPGFDASVLSEFRTRLIAGAAESLLICLISR
jgi:transposase